MINNIKFIARLIIFLVAFTAAESSMALNKKEVQFDCPDLHNSVKTSIEPLTQGYNGWFFRKNDLKMDFSLSPQTLSYFKRLNDTLANKNISLMITPLLSRGLLAEDMVNLTNPWQASYDATIAKKSYGNLIEELKSVNIDAIDLYTANSKDKRNDPYKYNFKRDIHWKPEGASIVAKAISPTLKNLPNYDSLTKVTTISKKQSNIGRSGTITKELQRLCNTKIKAEPFNIYESTQLLEKNADSLFGSQNETKPITLVGTSFSYESDFNFIPYLEEYSKLSIANFAIPGGGMFTSLIAYLSSPYFHENIPPAIIWETQSIYDFNKGTEYSFRQAIPAIHGTCSGSNIIAQGSVNIIENKPYILLDKLDTSKKIQGSSYYFHIFSHNVGFNNFTLELEYDDEDGEWFPIDRTDRFNNKGHYYIELSDQINSNLSKIILKNTKNNQTKIDIKLCKAPKQNRKQ